MHDRALHGIPDDIERRLDTAAKEFHQLVGGIDHIAYRVRTGEREPAVQELLERSPYRVREHLDIINEGARTSVLVFESGPAVVISEGLYDWTQVARYVKTYGPRVHHVAYSTNDIEAVRTIQDRKGVPFITPVIGCPEEGLLQMFTKPSPYTGDITEYIQRFNGFTGFLLQDHVGKLMKATEQYNGPRAVSGVGIDNEAPVIPPKEPAKPAEPEDDFWNMPQTD